MPLKRAKTWLRHIEELIAAADDGSTPDRETLRWAGGLADRVYEKLGPIERSYSGRWGVWRSFTPSLRGVTTNRLPRPQVAAQAN